MTSTSESSQSSTTSDFYNACRNGWIDVVREELPKIDVKDLDRVQANGSTALHAASYYGHTEIVKLLLEKGASRSIMNIHKNSPYDEASKDEIKQLFIRPSNRFSNNETGHVDWMECDAAAEELARDYRFRHTGFGWTPKNIERRLNHIRDEMSNTEQERIRIFLDQAKNDPKCLLKAYTVESDFYRSLNKDLATKHFDQGTNFGLTYFIDFFYNHPAFASLSYTGKVHRGVTMTRDDLETYSVGGKIMNKAFMSTTTVRIVAEEFARKEASNRVTQLGDHVKLSALCTFEIVNHRTGLNVESISEYQHEKEILVGPYTAFTIMAVRRIAPNYVEIDLQECEAPNETEDTEDEDDD